jgi:hypothetical protein
MDMYQYIPGVRLMFGSQCALAGATSGLWSFFDNQPSPNGTWHVSAVPCPLTSGTWSTISMTVHRVPGDTSCIGGIPAVHYDSLTQITVPLAPVTYTLNLSYCSEITIFANDTGMQFDVSSNVTGGTLTAYVDEMTFTAGTVATFPLAVTVTGSGTVTSAPSGIACGVTCFTTFNTGTVVTLTATPTFNHILSGWSGACSGTGTCSVTMSAAKTVTATFISSAAVTSQPYAAYTGTAVVQPPSTPDFGGLTKNNAIRYDLSYASRQSTLPGHQAPSDGVRTRVLMLVMRISVSPLVLPDRAMLRKCLMPVRLRRPCTWAIREAAD